MAAANFSTPSTSDPLPPIRDPRLLLAFRIVWVICTVTAVVVTVVSIPPYLRMCNCTPSVVAEWEQLGIASGVRLVFTILTAINMLILVSLSAFLAWRRPDDRMAMFVSLTSLVQGVFLVAGPAGPPDAWYYAVRMIDNFLNPISWVGLLFLFPNGRFYPPWTKWLLAGLIVLMAGNAILPQSAGGLVRAGSSAMLFVFIASLIVGLGAIIRRYRQTESATQRQQIKWTLYALAAVVILFAVLLPTQFLLKDPAAIAIFTIFRHILTAAAETLVPASIAFAILRYRLWNIDLVVNRVIVSVLTAAGLIVFFVLALIAVQKVIVATVPNQNSTIAVAFPVVITALLFNPVHRRVRNMVDRRLYGFRFDLNQLDEEQNKSSVSNPGFLTGQKLGDYTLLDVVGEGGMGEVYRGSSAADTGEMVAVKVLHSHMAQQPELRARFEREARALTSLSHPSIVRVLGYGATDETSYLLMELINGEDLNKRIKQEGPLPLSEVCDILDDMAAALDYAHEHGFIHRDIKPSNVMMKPLADNGGCRAVLMDFGLVKARDGHNSITGSNAIGTLDYMSPEQIMSAHEVDRRTDIYALGVMLYQMVTGELPFKGSLGQILFAHLQQPIPDPRNAAPDLPEGIAQAIMKALAKDPNERYKTVGQLAATFRHYCPVAA